MNHLFQNPAVIAQPVTEDISEDAADEEDTNFEDEMPSENPLFDRRLYENGPKVGFFKRFCFGTVCNKLCTCMVGAPYKYIVYNKSSKLREHYEKNKMKPQLKAVKEAVALGQLHSAMVMLEHGALEGVYTKKRVCGSSIPVDMRTVAQDNKQPHVYEWLEEVEKEFPDWFPKPKKPGMLSKCSKYNPCSGRKKKKGKK